jgi:hypothetical protein
MPPETRRWGTGTESRRKLHRQPGKIPVRNLSYCLAWYHTNSTTCEANRQFNVDWSILGMQWKPCMRSVFPGDSSQFFVYRSPGASFCKQPLRGCSISCERTITLACKPHQKPSLHMRLQACLSSLESHFLRCELSMCSNQDRPRWSKTRLTSGVCNNVRNLESQLFLRIVVRSKDTQQARLSSFLEDFILPPLNTYLTIKSWVTEPLSQTPPH